MAGILPAVPHGMTKVNKTKRLSLVCPLHSRVPRHLFRLWPRGRWEKILPGFHSFFRKLSQGVGPSIVLVIMAKLGYDGALGAAQSAQVALNMRYLVAALYLFSAAVMLISVWFVYNLDKKTLAVVKAELDRRHSAQN